ncbi:FecR family protein [Chitinophaga sancti]|uniref:FecR domain-containing protein n=1 Tax=Chitinophaga sancti TaxID=1004 RepID=A0A1K1R6E8_9BACT|nr:FecR domain-containing protein [Chitinophaga sancti]WQD64160.1 FecR domain-containing protein [Chitinophaga sancti]WQG90216.1 FecR domain-containing protein [Chitinophaga sancti]SFW67834.1 FecR family protein [Chitinophaga sancti]
MIPYIEQLMLEKLSGCISAEDDAELLQMMEAHQELKVVYKGLEERLGEPVAQEYLAHLDEDALWEQRKYHFKKRRSNKWLYAAAVFILLVSSSLFYFLHLPVAKPLAAKGIVLQLANGQQIDLSDTTKKGTLKVGTTEIHVSGKSLTYDNGAGGAETVMNVLRVPAGKDYKLVLADGTEVWMNAKSEIRFPMAFNAGKREVTISGEAFFSVKKDPARPFIVHAGEVSVDVLGTTFNINAYGSPRIALASGKVVVKGSNSDKAVALSPGFEATYSQHLFSIATFDERNTLGWMSGKYYFRHATLKEIGAVINRWFDIEVVFENSAAEHLDLTGILTRQDGLNDFLDNLEKTTGIQYEYKNGILRFR